MIRTGLVSITFRELQVEQIIDCTLRAGLDGIEWGGDLHVPHGDIKQAKEVRGMMEAAGLETSSYGSYYRFDEETLPFDKVLSTAVALNAPSIRVWAGNKSSEFASKAEWDNIVTRSREIADKAQQENIEICYEYHDLTLTDTNESALQLLKEVNHQGVKTFWQPPNGAGFDYCIEGLNNIASFLRCIHVFHWWPTANDRRPLGEGGIRWKKYLEAADSVVDKLWAVIEFVKDDSVEQFYEDAEFLLGQTFPKKT